MEKDLLLKGYELLTVLLPFTVVFAILAKRGRQRGGAVSVRRFLLLCVFAVYLGGVFYVTGAGTLFHLLRSGDEIHCGPYNFIPFSRDIFLPSYLLNILLFVPLGVLLPLNWPHTATARCALLSGLSFSLLIEASQLCNHRATDVDDLIMNTAGALVGYGLYKAFARVTKRRPGCFPWQKGEPLLLVGALFTGRFLLFNEMGLAKILYGF